MDKILRWYIDGNISRSKTEVGGTYWLDGDYRPEWVHMTCRIAGQGSTCLQLDINDDGTSIFDDNSGKPTLYENMTERTWTSIPWNTMRDKSKITLDIDQVFSEDTCRDLTVELGLTQV